MEYDKLSVWENYNENNNMYVRLTLEELSRWDLLYSVKNFMLVSIF